MADAVPDTKPPLTAAMVEADKATGASPPGAGGWCPTPLQRLLISSGAAAATAAIDLSSAPVIDLKVVAIAAAKAAIAYFIAHFGTLSAGTREVTKP